MAHVKMSVAEARARGFFAGETKRPRAPKPAPPPVRAYAVCVVAPGHCCATCLAWLETQGLPVPGIVRREATRR